MKRNRTMFQRLAVEADVAADLIPGVPLVELAGDRRVLVENHRGVTEYGIHKICVLVSYGCLWIEGEHLKLSHMSRENLVICGRIQSISLVRKEA